MAEDSRKLFVAGLPDSINEEILRQLFEATGGNGRDPAKRRRSRAVDSDTQTMPAVRRSIHLKKTRSVRTARRLWRTFAAPRATRSGTEVTVGTRFQIADW